MAPWAIVAIGSSHSRMRSFSVPTTAVIHTVSRTTANVAVVHTASMGSSRIPIMASAVPEAMNRLETHTAAPRRRMVAPTPMRIASIHTMADHTRANSESVKDHRACTTEKIRAA